MTTRILVTNDDGIRAEGIQALADCLRGIEDVEVTVVAPDRERSTVSHSLTLHRPLRRVQLGADDYSVDGTPSDSVFIALVTLFSEKKPDYVFSGFNHGGNLGDDVHYSGTVSAAVEGAIMGVPSVAFSQLGREGFDFSMAQKFVPKFLKLIQNNPFPPHIVMNVNIPQNVTSLDFEITKTGKRDYGGLYEERVDPRGRRYYWIGGDKYNFYDVPGSDCNAIVQNKITVSPLEINLTSHEYIEKMKQWSV